MPRLLIDNRKVEVPSGSTILDAARKLGLDIPTLCFLDGYKPSTSCMICLVKVKNQNRLVPSCATPAEDGMEVESETEEVHQVRRTGLELLLSDHVGDCTAPCRNTCPTHMDIPLMLRQVAAGELLEAIGTIKKDIALPAVLGRVCPELCERTCRRQEVDQAASICQVKRYVADVDLAVDTPYLPACKPSSGRNVAIVGTGPTALAAAYHLRQDGHACTLLDEHAEPGGVLRYEFDEEQLPRRVLDGEIAIIQKMGARFEMGVRIGLGLSLTDLTKEYDAVLLAAGPLDESEIQRSGLQTTKGRLQVNAKTFETNLPGVFAAGEGVQPSELIVRGVAAGKDASVSIDQFLSGAAVTGVPRLFNVRAGRMSDEEIARMAAGASDGDRVIASQGPAAGLTAEEALAEALRCLNCDCAKPEGCKLRHYAQKYGATAQRYRGTRRVFERHLHSLYASSHASPDSLSRLPAPTVRDAGASERGGTETTVVYEPGKCIMCGLCVQIATECREPLGLTFIGRGFDVRVSVPFDRSIAEALTRAAHRCVEACPTSALSLRSQTTCRLSTCTGCPSAPDDPPT